MRRGRRADQQTGPGRCTTRWVRGGYLCMLCMYIITVVTAVAAGAHMGFSAGWEVPLWYSAPGSAPSYQPSFFRTNWQREQVAAYLQYLQYLKIYATFRAENTSCSPPPWPWPTSPGLYQSISTKHISTLILTHPRLQFRQVLADRSGLRAAAGRGHGGRGAEAGAHSAVPHADPGGQGDHLDTWTML